MSIGVGWNKRGYATKLDYQGTRERLEEYVEERGCVPRERAMEDVIQQRHTGSYQMNTGQVGQLIKYSRKRGKLTSFTHNGQYFITTVDRMNEFTKGNWEEVNARAREPKKENFLTGIIERGRARLAREEKEKLEKEIAELRIQSLEIREVAERKKRGDPENVEYKGEEKGIITLSKELEEKGKDLKKTLDESKKTSETAFKDMFDAMIGFRRSQGSKDKTKPFRTPGMSFKKENPGYRLPGGSSYAEGNLRTAMREFLKTEVKEGRLKLNETDLFRITEYSPRSADDPIDVFRRYYGEAAMEAADKMAKKLEQGTSFKNYEEIFRANMPQLKIKTQGAGLYDQSIIDAERVLKKAKDQEDYAKTLDEFDITDRTKNAHGGLIDVLKL